MNRKTGYIMVFSLKKSLNNSQRARFFRDLYGYDDYSQYGKYFYSRGSILGRDTKYYGPQRAVLIVRKEYKEEVLSFLQKKAKVYIWKIVLTDKDIKELY